MQEQENLVTACKFEFLEMAGSTSLDKVVCLMNLSLSCKTSLIFFLDFLRVKIKILMWYVNYTSMNH